MVKEKRNKGFTLGELIVAIVVSSIVLTLISYFVVKFVNLSEEVKFKRKMTYEQNVVTKFFDDFVNNVNLNGYVVNINYANNIIYYQYEMMENILINRIIIDNESKTLKYNDKIILEFSSIKQININKSNDFSNIFSVEIIFNNDTTYVFSKYIINSIREE